MLTAYSIQEVSLRVQREVVADVTSPFFSVLSLPAHVAKLAQEFLEEESQEVVLVFILDSAQRLVAFTEATRGTVEASLVTVREIYRAAVVHGGCAIAIAHNHPSGSVAPSDADHVATRALSQAGDILGIPLLDHIIVAAGTDEYYSFRQMGMLDRGTVQ